MKNVILSTLAGLVAVVVFAPDAAALPVFARQTGMACSSCHFQHFPMLNGFGRAFKSAGYTLIGTQGKVEGEALSIPNTLNMAVLTTAGYEKTNQASVSFPTKTTGDGALYVPGAGGELALFFGGRVNENAGFLAELGIGGQAGAAANAASALGSAKLPVMFELTSAQIKGMDGARVGIVPFTTDVQGASYGFELLNTGANAVHQMSGTPGLNGAHASVLSAQQYINTNGYATGVALVANNPLGFINLTKYNQTGAGGAFAGMTSTYIRIAGTFNLAGWDAAAGIQNWSGKSATVGAAGLAGPVAETEATAIDGQMQGTWNGMPVGLYASYAMSPAPAAGALSTYNYNFASVSGAVQIGTETRSALNVSGEVGVMPEKLTVGAALRYGVSGAKISGTNATDNAIMLIATYKLAQNMLASASLTKANGAYWYSNGTSTGTIDKIGDATLTVNLFTLF